MDGDARQPGDPQPPSAYKLHVDYDARPALEARPRHGKGGADDDEKAEGDDDEKAEGDGDEGGDDAAKKPMSRGKKILYWVVGLAVLAVLVIGGVLYWLNARNYASTDDAFIDGYISQVSPQVGGRVTDLAITDYQDVKAGQLLVAIDARDYQVRLEQARAQRAQAAAQLEQASAGLLQQQAAVDQAQANVRVSEADAGQALSDFARYRGIDPRAVSRQTVENAGSSTKAAQARVDASRQAVAAAQANVASQKAQIGAAQANLQAADVAVANAQLQLSYTQIVAPRDGKIARRTVNLGDYVSPGQSLLAVVGEDRWVTANYKETQIAGMRPGQTVSIEVDGCPDHGLRGTVDSFQPGSGSVFSALPAENATGNYVKVVQRIPVRILIRHEDAVRCRISPGMSVIPSVRLN